MISQVNARFRKSYEALKPEIRKKTQSKYRLWQREIAHPSLQFKCVIKSQNIWSARIDDDFRALSIRLAKPERIIWFWIGHHKEYDRLIKKS